MKKRSPPRRRAEARNKLLWLPLWIVCLWTAGLAQNGGAPDFVRQERNLIIYPDGDSAPLSHFFTALDQLFLRGQRQVRVVHLGDSHIQADYFSGRLRTLLQEFTSAPVGRGWIFPYRVARTNGPEDYSVSYRGRWRRCRNIDKEAVCDLGVSGISVSTDAPSASITLEMKDDLPFSYGFTLVRVFHAPGEDSFQVDLGESEEVVRSEDRQAGVTLFRLPDERRRLTLELRRTEARQTSFTLHGLSLENPYPGLLYHAMGVNGADAESFLRCVLLEEHLEILAPDLVIVSLGTNDAIGGQFDQALFLGNMESLISRIRQAVPQASLLLTTPGDNYRRLRRRNRVPNRNNLEARKSVLRAAQISDTAVWDFFDVMGGLYSIRQWQRQGLSSYDKVHLSKQGYQLQGELLFQALQRAYQAHTQEAGSRR
ncbi:MAG TPA: GDSL-type esterase/lipase family protein [Acidobacteriota bacterium]|nr:GDSL-type esterase/lipase family protein [Acidobacteriota bacterium]